MPNYLFYCDYCNREKQVAAEISEEIEAPYCHDCEQDMTRQFGVGAVKFVGVGWAKNDS